MMTKPATVAAFFIDKEKVEYRCPVCLFAWTDGLVEIQTK